MLQIAVGILITLLILMCMYIIYFKLQLRSINRQLTKRLTEKSRQPVSLELISPSLNSLTININNCLSEEEHLRIASLREEKEFKEMIANISHDLRTPLTAIKGYQQLLAKSELSEDQLKKLQIAEKHADELEALIEHLFEYSYLLNTNLSPNLERFNLVNLTAECLAESIPMLEEHNLTVDFKEAPPVFVMADKEMTVRIIQNLIRNCIQHSQSGIEVQVLHEKNAVILFKNKVENPSEIDITRLFDRFYTADVSRGKSTGIGLSIVKLLAEEMGGFASAALIDGFLKIRVELPKI